MPEYLLEQVEKEVAEYITDNSSGSIDYVSLLTIRHLHSMMGQGRVRITCMCSEIQKTRLIDNRILM